MSDQEPKAQDLGLQGRVFLERRGYRQRRIIDAARILHVLGLLLWCVPLVWPSSDESGAISTSTATLYIFAIWTGLIGVGAFLAWKMEPAEETSLQTGEAGERIDARSQQQRGPTK